MTKGQKVEELIFRVLMNVFTWLVGALLLLILISVLWRALPALSLDMITKTPHGGFYYGKEGGILNAIIGSLYLGFGATILAFVISLPLALYMNLYLAKSNKRWFSAKYSSE